MNQIHETHGLALIFLVCVWKIVPQAKLAEAGCPQADAVWRVTFDKPFDTPRP
jgi:hypothetical protein